MNPSVESNKRPYTRRILLTDRLIACVYSLLLADTHCSILIYQIPGYGHCRRYHFIQRSPNPNPQRHQMTVVFVPATYTQLNV